MKQLLLFFVASGLFAAPEVSKMEPPNWWVGHSLHTVRLLIHGRDLRGATVQCSAPGVKTGAAVANAAGTYLFVDLEIQKRAKPGSVPLRIVTPQGTATAPFQLLAPLAREGRFQGFSPEDVIYLIMPDRFANGERRKSRRYSSMCAGSQACGSISSKTPSGGSV